MPKTTNPNNNYTTIQTLEGLTGIRAKLGMYLGSTTSQNNEPPKALTQMFQETLANSIDEHTAGHATKINITLHHDNTITIQDNGRGIPRGNNWDVITRAFTKTHSSGKFDQTAYTNAGTTGTHGIGMKAVNAASQFLKIDVTNQTASTPTENQYEQYSITFNQETITDKHLQTITKPTSQPLETGTTVTFKPDTRPISQDNPKPVLANDNWDINTLIDRCETAATLAPTLTITLETPNTYQEFNHPDGLEHLIEPSSIAHDVTINQDGRDYNLTVAIGLTPGVFKAYANGVDTPNGTHITGLLYELEKQLNQTYEDTFTRQDILDTLSIAFHLQLPADTLEFEGQTKETLSTAEARQVMRTYIAQNFMDWLHDNPNIMKEIGEQLAQNKHAREQAAKARQIAKTTKPLTRKQKLAFASKAQLCTGKNPAENELFVTEGDSASNIGRNPKTQTVIPLRGKILNVFKLKQPAKALENSEVQAIVQILGAGITKNFDIDSVSHHKFIIAADADDDGAHIQTLIIGLCFTLFPGLIEAGMVYVVESPLFKAVGYDKTGKPVVTPFYTVRELEEGLPKLGKVDVRRYKGLGEMNGREAHDAIANPLTRRLRRITVDDVGAARRLLGVVVGDDVKARRLWVDSLDFSVI